MTATAILVPSCDAYSDAWDPFFQLFFRYWPDCPYPLYLVSERETYPDPRVHNVSLGDDRGWASNVLRVLPELDCSSILYLQEDYFLQRPVDTALLEEVFAYAEREGIGYIRLAGVPDPDLPHQNPFGLGEVSRGTKYRISLQASWWNLETLRALLVEGEVGWDMEHRGTVRSCDRPEPFLAVFRRKPLIPYYFWTGILKGKWMPAALRQCRREGIPVDVSRRPIQSEWPIILKQIRRSRPVKAVRSWVQAAKR